MSSDKLRIYKMNDCDIVIAHSRKEAIEWYEDYTTDISGEVEENIELVRNLKKGFWWNCYKEELFMEKMRSLKEGDELKVGVWASNLAYWVTYEEVLKDSTKIKDMEIPGIISTTEW